MAPSLFEKPIHVSKSDRKWVKGSNAVPAFFPAGRAPFSQTPATLRSTPAAPKFELLED